MMMTTTTSSILDTRALTEYERDGFVVVRGLFDAAEMRELRACVDALGAWPETPGEHMMASSRACSNRGVEFCAASRISIRITTTFTN